MSFGFLGRANISSYENSFVCFFAKFPRRTMTYLEQRNPHKSCIAKFVLHSDEVEAAEKRKRI